MEAASITVGCNRDDLEAALAKTGGVNPFSGNALSSFFDYNPFSSKEVDRDYERYCYEEVNKVPKAEVDQIFADRDLGKKLFKKLKDKCKKDNNDKVSYYLCPMCCSPSRHKGKLRFWINTGRDTQLDGWKSPEDIEAFLNSNEVLKDTASCQ